MISTTARICLAAAAAAAVAPFASARPSCIRDPLTTSVTYSQAPLAFSGTSFNSTSSSCGTDVAAGNLTAGTCADLLTLAIGIGQKQDRQCSFTLWTGSHTCNGTTAPTKIVIPQGEDSTCVFTGVYDGGKYFIASGMYWC
ncbi:hypothetical protein ANO11243_002620 [Dothideomycetidae sp. 11243]|nr:hypothetical protein ANO11243_002620 [fungal sp. No.11243]